MSSPEIKVTFAALATAQSDIQATVGRIHTQLEDLKRYLAPMVATWSGQAAAEYQVAQRKWDTSADDLAAVLHQIGQHLGRANETYQVTEQRNRERWMA